jgi:hypothetical protein
MQFFNPQNIQGRQELANFASFSGNQAITFDSIWMKTSAQNG